MGLAEKFISSAKTRKAGFSLTKEAREELKMLMEYNETAPKSRKVTAEDALAMLDAGFGLRISRHTFDRIVKRDFGRTFGGGR